MRVDGCIAVYMLIVVSVFCFFQAEDGIRDLVRSRGLGDVYKRQGYGWEVMKDGVTGCRIRNPGVTPAVFQNI